MKAMFKKRLLKLADIIENNKPVVWKDRPVKFSMGDWATPKDCGTAACIAGHAAILSGSEFNAHTWQWTQRSNSTLNVAKDWLGMDMQHALELFLPTEYSNYRGLLENVTRRRAATVLRHFAETGEIKWNMKLS